MARGNEFRSVLELWPSRFPGAGERRSPKIEP